MTAPFNPTELARKHAELYRTNLLHPTADNINDWEAKVHEARVQFLLSFARDLIAQSGIEKHLIDCRALLDEAAEPLGTFGCADWDAAARGQIEDLDATLNRLRSITEAERGGAK